jgi:putative phage-type endonuclease
VPRPPELARPPQEEGRHVTVTLDDLGRRADVVIPDTTEVPREIWLEERRKGIGASDAAAALGLSPWVSPVALYYDKVDPAPDRDTERMKRGRQLEASIVGMFADETGHDVTRLPAMLRSRTHPFMLANYDGFVGEAANVEAKNVDRFARHEWAEGVPLHYYLQCQHAMYVRGPSTIVTYVAALIGGNELVVYEVERSDDVIADLIAKEEAFWSLVNLRRVPEIDGSDATTEALSRVYAKPDGTYIEAGVPMAHLLAQREGAKSEVDAAKVRLQAIDNAIKAKIGPHEGATVDGQLVVTWPEQTRKSYTVKESTFRRLNVVGKEGK